MKMKKINIQITLIAIFLFQCYSFAQPDSQSIPVIKDLVEISGENYIASAEVTIPKSLQEKNCTTIIY